MNSSCPEGFECKQLQECDDYGCHPPSFECVPREDFIFTADETPARAQQASQTPAPAAAAAAPSTAARSESGGPSRLIIRTQNDRNSILRFDSSLNQEMAYQISMSPQDGSLRISNNEKTVMAINHEGTDINCTDNVRFRVSSIEVSNLWNIAGNQLNFNGVPQWKLVHDEIFRVGQHAEGWNIPDSITQCGAIHMIGGY